MAGWDYLGASLDGDIKVSLIDGAQLYEDKESDCWITIWLVLNLSPSKWYHKTHVLPGRFIPGPKKPKNIDSFMVVRIWDSSRNEVFHSDLLLRSCKLLVGTLETPELVGVGWDLALAYVLCPCC